MTGATTLHRAVLRLGAAHRRDHAAGVGLVMVFSASLPAGLEGFGDPYHFVTLQVVWIVVGLAALVVAAHVPYMLWERWSIPLMGRRLLVLLMAVIAFGSERFGATRTFFDGSVQPSEPAKLAIIIYVSAWLTSKGRRIRDVQVGLLPFGVLMGDRDRLDRVAAGHQHGDPDRGHRRQSCSSSPAPTSGSCWSWAPITAATFALVINFSSYARERVERYLASSGNPLPSNEWQVQQGSAGAACAAAFSARASATARPRRQACCPSVGATTSSP